MKKSLLLLLLCASIGMTAIAEKANAVTISHKKVTGEVQSCTADSAHWSYKNNYWMCVTPSYTQPYGDEWIYTNGKWYFVDENGYMLTSTFIDIKNDQFYVDANGVMQTGWTKIGTDWYYFWNNGTKSSNTIIDGYVLGPDGRWER